MADLGILALGNSTAPNVWTSAPNGALTLIGAGDQDTANAHAAQNNTGTNSYDQGYEIGALPADFDGMLTLALQLRYGWNVYDASRKTWDTLSARVMSGATVLAAADSGGTFQTIASSISNTTPADSSVISFTYVNTDATPAQWATRVTEIRTTLTRIGPGNTNEARVYAASLTGTYDALIVSGAGGATQGKSTVSGIGYALPFGVGAVVQGEATASGVGTLRLMGSGAATQGKSTASGTGTATGVVISGGTDPLLFFLMARGAAPTPTGAGGATQGKSTASGIGYVRPFGVGGATQGEATATGTGLVRSIGTGAATQGEAVAVGTGYVVPLGTGGATQSKSTASGIGTYTSNDPSGAGGATQGKSTASGIGAFTPPPIFGSGAPVQGKSTASGTGTQTFVGSGAATQSEATASGVGSQRFIGTGAATQGEAVATGVGTLRLVGIGTATQSESTAAGTGYALPAGFGGTTQSEATAAGTGFITFVGLGGAVQGKSTASGTGTNTGVLVITTTHLSNPVHSIAYSQFVVASGGVTPYTWAISAGALPTGLTINSTTGEISGTPTAFGEFTFTVQVTDGATPAQVVTRQYIVTIAALPIKEIPQLEHGIENVVNAIEIEIVTREVEPEQVVWRAIDPIELGPNEVVTLHARDRGSPAAWLLDAIAPTTDDYLMHGDWITTTPFAATIRSIAYNGSRLVAVGDGGLIRTSDDDGATWTTRTSGTSSQIRKVRYGGGIFLAISLSGGCWTSPDGVSWTSRSIGSFGQVWDMAYGDGRWIITGLTGTTTPKIIYSTNSGLSWTIATITSSVTFTEGVTAVVYTGQPLYPWIVTMGQHVIVSEDGISFTTVGGPSGMPTSGNGDRSFQSLGYDAARNKIIAVGWDLVYVGTPDPSTWVRHELPVTSVWLHVLVAGGAVWLYGCKQNGFGSIRPGTINAVAMNRSLDPGDWLHIDTPTDPEGSQVGYGISLTPAALLVYEQPGGNLHRLPIVALNSVVLGRDSGGDIPITITNGPTAGTLSQLQLRAKRVVEVARDSVVDQVDTTASKITHGDKSFNGKISPDISRVAAQALANLYVNTFQHGLKHLGWQTVHIDEPSFAAMLDREIGDRVHVSVSRREIDSHWIITSIEDRMSPGDLHQATYTGIPAPPVVPF